MIEEASRNGALLVADANLEPNSPKERCWAFFSTKPKLATSQNAVEPPTPKTTSYPSGARKNCARPSRTEPTRFLTGACRWEVPRMFLDAADSASICSWRTLEGPAPNRPSRGRRSAGIVMLGSLTGAPISAWTRLGPDGYSVTGGQPATAAPEADPILPEQLLTREPKAS